MALNGTEKLTLSGLEEPTPQKNQKEGLKSRIYRWCKSAFSAYSVKLNPSYKQVGIGFGIYMGVGTFCFYIVRHHFKGKDTNGLVDAIYYVVSVVTTIGNGDLVPDNNLTKVLSNVFAFIGMGVVGLVMGKTGEYLAEKQERMLVKAIHLHQKLGPNEVEKELETNLAMKQLIAISTVTSALALIGTFHLCVVEGFDFIDAFYWVGVTITTLGYPDESFKHTKGRIFAVFWMMSSTMSLAQFFLKIIEMKFECRQMALVKLVLAQMTKNKDLEAADHDGDKGVESSEYILHKLKEMGKITQEDISLAMKEFEGLDRSGSLSAPDTKPVKPSETEN